jgi:hypothetical protein
MYTQATPPVAEPIVVNLSPPEVKAAAGGQPVEVVAEVRNAGSTMDHYDIEIEDLDPSWYTITVKSVSLFPGESAAVPIMIHPPTGKETRAGHHAFVAVARSHADPTLAGKTNGAVQVGAYVVFRMELAPARFTGRVGKYKLKMANGGNSELQLDLQPRDHNSKLNYGLQKTDRLIQPGGTMVTPLSVKPKGFHLVGPGDRYNFSVIGKPVEGAPEDAREVHGELIHKPLFATWKFPLLVLAVLVMLGLFLALRPDVEFCSPTARGGLGPFVRSNVGFLYGAVCTGYVVTPDVQPDRTPTSGHKFDETTFNSGAGYVEVRDKYGDTIGQAEEHEWYDKNGVSHQKTTRGQLMYFVEHDSNSKDGVPRIYFITNDGKAFTFVDCNPPHQFKSCDMAELAAPR